MFRRVAVIVSCAIAILGILPHIADASPLRTGDHIAITIFNHPDLSIPQGTIDAEGKVALPLVGNVAIAGLEPDAAASKISSALKVFLREPSVTLQVVAQNTTIAIVGTSVSSLTYAPGQTLASVVASQASTPGLDLHHVRVDRDGSSLGTFDGQAFVRSGQPGPLLEPGDTVTFAIKPIGVDVVGSVKTPGMQYLDVGQTIADAVEAAGVADENAATGMIDVFRDGKHMRVALSSDAASQAALDGDVVTVPQAMTVSVSGLVAKPGVTALTAGNTLVAAIYMAGGPLRFGDVSHTRLYHDGVLRIYDVPRAFDGDASQNPHLSEGDVVSVPESRHIVLGDIFGGVGVLHLLW